MFKYNETSCVGQFIQNLLRNSPTPILPILTDQQYKKAKEIKGFHYIYGRDFYNEDKPIESYVFGKQYLNITDNYIPLQDYYSTETHEHLGNYLRSYSEYYKINLMGLYNCFSNRLISNISLPLSVNEQNTSNKKVKNVWYTSAGPRDDCTITCFPIRVDSSYTIKIYGSVKGNIIIQPIFYNGSTYIKINGNNRNTVIFNESIYGYTNNITYTFDESIYGNKISYDKLLQNQKYLYLFIQVPVVEGLRISVIEDSNFFNVVNKSLLNLSNINYNVPFSDKLLEFLVGNVITREDPIKQNITRVQNLIDAIKPKGVTFTEYEKGASSVAIPPYNDIVSTDKEYSPIPGMYDDTLRIILYDYLSGREISDFTGYVDKDVEEILVKDASVKTLYSKGTYPFQNNK